MALICCPECGKEVSDTSDICIHCGHKIKTKKNERLFSKANVVWLIAALLSGFILIRECILSTVFREVITPAIMVKVIFWVVAIWMFALVMFIVLKLFRKK